MPTLPGGVNCSRVALFLTSSMAPIRPIDRVSPTSGSSFSVANSFIEKGGEFYHGFTYSGHPAACAVALKNIEIMRREGLVERVRDETGPHLAKALATLADHPLVGEVRSMGLIGAIELVKDKATREHFDPPGKVGTICRDHCINNGMVMRAVRDIMIMSPPLIITTQQIDDLIDHARKAIDATARDIGVM